MTMGYLAVLLCCFGLLPHIHSKSCNDIYGSHCVGCNDNECTECETGHCGSSCEDNCIGHCGYACHKTNCSCEACADGYHGDGCSSPCSGRCYKDDSSKTALCQRNGMCTGCKYGFCLPNTTCDKRCNKGCLDDDCDAYTCECRSGCNDSCNETKRPNFHLPNCRNQTCKEDVCIGCIDGRHGVQCQHKCDNCEVCYQLDGTCIQVNHNILPSFWISAVIHIVACMIFLHIKSIATRKNISLWNFVLELRCKGIQLRVPIPQTDESNRVQLQDNRPVGAWFLDGTRGKQKYIATQQPMKIRDEEFWDVIWERDVSVIVYLSSKQEAGLDSNLRTKTYLDCLYFEKAYSDGKYETWTLSMSRDASKRIVTLYHYSEPFEVESFCHFVKAVRKKPNYTNTPIAVCSSEGDVPTSLFITLDQLLDNLERGSLCRLTYRKCVDNLNSQTGYVALVEGNMMRLRNCYDTLRVDVHSSGTIWVPLLFYACIGVYVIIAISISVKFYK